MFCCHLQAVILLMSRFKRKQDFRVCEKQRHRSAVLISTFVFATPIVQSLFTYIQNFKLLAIFCDCTGQFVSFHIRNPEDRFSRVMAHILILFSSCIFQDLERLGKEQDREEDKQVILKNVENHRHRLTR